jgi:hypothetical protein
MIQNPLSKQIVQQIHEFPPYLLEELSVYIEFLASKRKVKKERKFRLNWVGALEAENKNYTSLELQKKALDWRNL